jgi:hypothetical protein
MQVNRIRVKIMISLQPNLLTREQRVIVAESEEEFLQRHYLHLQQKKGKGPETEDLEVSVTKSGRPVSSSTMSLRMTENLTTKSALPTTGRNPVSSLPSVNVLLNEASPSRSPPPPEVTAPVGNTASVDAAKRDELRNFFDTLLSKSAVCI